MKKPLRASIKKAFHRGELNHFQKQAVIKLIEIIERYLITYRTLLNIDTKLISKVLVERLKNVLPCLISSDQTAYVKGRFIRKGHRLRSDVLEMCDKLQIKGFFL